MELDLASMTKEIEAAIEANPECGGNILLQNRVFYRKQRGKHEMLVSLNNKSKGPHYWGHIFLHNERYVSCIVAFEFWHNYNLEDLFDMYHYNLEALGYWYPIGGDTLNFSEDITGATAQLISMIRNFEVEQTFKRCNYLITQLYPFPNVFAEWISFDEWKKIKEGKNARSYN